MKANFLEYTKRTTCFENKNSHSCIPCALVFPGSVFWVVYFSRAEKGKKRSCKDAHGGPRGWVTKSQTNNPFLTLNLCRASAGGTDREGEQPWPFTLQRPGEQPRGTGHIASASRHLSRSRFYAVPQTQVSDPRLHPQPSAGPGAHLPYN